MIAIQCQNFSGPLVSKTDGIDISDSDSRRWLRINWKNSARYLERQDEWTERWDFIKATAGVLATMRQELDTGPHTDGLTALSLTKDGGAVGWSVDPDDDVTLGTHYAPSGDYHLPPHIEILACDELVELDRMQAFMDVVEPLGEQERLVFRHYQHAEDVALIWNCIHIAALLRTKHPHILPVRYVVISEMDDSRVVGFTLPFIRGHGLPPPAGCVLKLKWVKQLIRTLDDMYLLYSITYGDSVDGNIIIDQESDSVVLIGFGEAVKIGTLDRHWHHIAAVQAEPETALNPEAGVASDVVWAIMGYPLRPRCCAFHYP